MSAFRRILSLAALGATALATAGPALADPPWARGHRHHRHWGPPPGVYYAPPPPPVYYAPPPVVYAPPPPVYYAPPPRVYYPPPPPPALGFTLNVPLR
jgi:hypothetical protein